MKEILEKDFLTAQEISKYFMLPLNTVYRLSKNGSIKGIKIGRQWRYLKTEIKEMLGDRPLSNKNTEKREFPRINCNLHCEYKISIPSIKHFYSVTGNIRNISGGGVLLCDKPENLGQVLIGDPIELYFKLPTDSCDISIEVLGRIIRKSGHEDVIDEIGVKFRNINKYYQCEILNYVD